MAVAGRVAIRPSGAFDIETSYERLDMVKYQNTLFIAKKAVSGVVPAEGEFWMDCGGTELSEIEKKIRALETPEFIEAEELAALENKKPNSTLWGRVAKAVSILITHLGNKENPHAVTAAQTGALTKDNILNSTVATEAGQYAADAVQLNKEVEGSYAAGVVEEISLINTNLVQRTNTKEASPEKSLANLKETGIYAVRDADDMPNGKTAAILEVNNFAPQNGNYCIQRVVYIEDYKKIYQRRLHQEEGAGAWEEFVSISVFSDALPYIFSYFTSQPFFVISESNQDTMYCNGRGCRRNSSAKALIFKRGGALKDVAVTSGYGIISYTNSDVSCTALTDHGGVSTIQKRTPKGNIVSIGIMGAAWVNTGGTASFPVIAAINGKTHELTNSILYASDPKSYLFILCMADFYLF